MFVHLPSKNKGELSSLASSSPSSRETSLRSSKSTLFPMIMKVHSLSRHISLAFVNHHLRLSNDLLSVMSYPTTIPAAPLQYARVIEISPSEPGVSQI